MTTNLDPDLRRATPLAGQLTERIHKQGPIPVESFILQCLTDPAHGYYTTRTTIGSDGDFTTAPEISQVFGELIGVWCALVWQQMQCPEAFDLVELGPGRGTLMADVLRVFAKVPGLTKALRLHLVELSPKLAHLQDAALAGSSAIPRRWHSLEQFARAAAHHDGPAIIIANEYLDALGVAQFVAQPCNTEQQVSWHRRFVGVDDTGLLQFETEATPTIQGPDLPQLPHTAKAHDIFEHAPAIAGSVIPALTDLAERQPLASLFIDYGHTASAIGETLQAIRNHAYEHPLTSPGQADLTAHVDFAALARSATSAGLAVDGPFTQAEFLGRLGIIERTSHLMSANPDQAAMIEAGTLRLMAPNGMGSRFKAIALRSPSLAPLPCFQLQ